jgi:hypothetical protein
MPLVIQGSAPALMAELALMEEIARNINWAGALQAAFDWGHGFN